MEAKGTLCPFNGCSRSVEAGKWRCSLHRNRMLCKISGCNRQVYARQLCVGHGGKKPCQKDNCDRPVRLGIYCSHHLAAIEPTMRQLCDEVGCANIAIRNRRCVRHGGRRQCLTYGCTTHARSGGYCCRHARMVKDEDFFTTKSIKAIDMLQSDNELADFLSEVDWGTESFIVEVQ